MLNLKNRKQEGFTIIEVLIVLAIAGLIMLVVFLAVPALRRNAANNGRQSDASKISSAITDCLANRNGLLASCDTTAEADIDTTKLAQLTGTISFVTAVSGGANKDLATFNATAAQSIDNTNNPDAIRVGAVFNAKCSAAGDDYAYSANSRDYVVIWAKKTTSNVSFNCIGS